MSEKKESGIDHLGTAEAMIIGIHKRANETSGKADGQYLLDLAKVHALIDIAHSLRELYRKKGDDGE